MSTTTIERAAIGDFPQVLSLLKACDLPDGGLADHLSTLLVAREGGKVVGSAGLELYGDCALLRSVAVSPAMRGAGLGQRLTRAVIDLAKAKGVRRIYLLTRTAEGYFARFGFATIVRSDVSPGVTASAEFNGACPKSAAVMELSLQP